MLVHTLRSGGVDEHRAARQRLRVRSGASLVVLLSGMACSQQVEVSPPAIEDQSAILFVVPEGPNPRVRAYGLEVGETLPVLVLGIDDNAYLAALSGPLGGYGLRTGELELTADPNGPPLPWAEADFYGLQTENASWVRTEVLPDAVTQLRRPAVDCTLAETCVRLFEGRALCDSVCPQPSPPEAPAAPVPPEATILSCPDDWPPSEGVGCAPFERVSPACRPGDWQPPGQAVCVPLLDCPNGARWQPIDTGSGAVYVDGSAPPSGDGTQERPFRTLDEALAGRRPPVTVGVAAGQYAAPSLWPGAGPVALVGACPSAVELNTPLLVPPELELRLSGMRVGAGLRVEGRLELESVQLEGPTSAVVVADGELDVDTARIVAPVLGIAANASSERALSLRRVTLEATREAGLRVEGGTHIEIEDLAIWPAGGLAIGVQGDAEVRLTTLWAGRSEDAPTVEVRGSGRVEARQGFFEASTFAVVSDDAELVLRDVGVLGAARTLQAGDRARFEAVNLVSQSLGSGFSFEAAGESIVDIRGLSAEGEGGILLGLRGQAEARVESARILGFERAARLTETSRLTVRRMESDGGFELGPNSGDGLFSSYVGGPQFCSVSGLGPTPSQVTLDAEDVVIAGAQDVGIAACPGTVARVARIAVRPGPRVALGGECRGTCSGVGDLTVRMTAEDIDIEGGERGETGIFQRGGSLMLRRARVEGLRLFGLYVWGSAISAEDVSVASIRGDVPEDPSLRDTYCSQAASGQLRGAASAIMVEAWSEGSGAPLSDPSGSITRFLFREAGCSGLTLGFNGRLSLQEGEISENLRGVNNLRGIPLQIAPNVLFRNNRQADIFGEDR